MFFECGGMGSGGGDVVDSLVLESALLLASPFIVVFVFLLLLSRQLAHALKLGAAGLGLLNNLSLAQLGARSLPARAAGRLARGRGGRRGKGVIRPGRHVSEVVERDGEKLRGERRHVLAHAHQAVGVLEEHVLERDDDALELVRALLDVVADLLFVEGKR